MDPIAEVARAWHAVFGPDTPPPPVRELLVRGTTARELGALPFDLPERTVASFADFVALIRAQPRGSVRRLVVVDHGYPGGHEFGRDILRAVTDPASGETRFITHPRGAAGPEVDVTADVRSLAPHFAADAVIELHGCNTGFGESGRAFTAALARACGTTTRAGAAYQYPTVDGYEGAVTECRPSAACSTRSTGATAPPDPHYDDYAAMEHAGRAEERLALASTDDATAAAHWLAAAPAFSPISHPLSVARAAARSIGASLRAGATDISDAIDLIARTRTPHAIEYLRAQLRELSADVRRTVSAALSARLTAYGYTELAARASF